jgi:phosphosulfolactate synthase
VTPDLLELRQRSAKPRDIGITHVLDRGLSLADVEGLIEVTGGAVDIVKLGWGTAVVSENLERKVARYQEYGIPVVLGGTLTELAIAQARLERLLELMRSLGLRHIEVSDGTITLAHEAKVDLIRRLADEFTVLSEVGSKDDTRIMAPYRWVEQIQSELDAGAWKVIAEARESGTSGIFRHDGEVRMGLIDEIVHAIPVEQLIFETPRKDQQVWFIRRFGGEVNLGNIAPEDVLSLETIRLGLRSDTALEGMVGIELPVDAENVEDAP